MTLDDYAPPLPLWMVVCAVLSRAGARGLTIGKTHAQCVLLTDGRYVRASSVSEVLSRMRADGIVERCPPLEVRTLDGSQPHRLTVDGQELYASACALVVKIVEREAIRGTKTKN